MTFNWIFLFFYMKITMAEKLILARKTSMIINETFYLNKIRLRKSLKTTSKPKLRKCQSLITPDYHLKNYDGREV